MKFARIVFGVAAAYGLLTLLPLYSSAIDSNGDAPDAKRSGGALRSLERTGLVHH